MTVAERKSIHEEFARFFERPTREGLRDLIRTNVGERDEFDFKEDWPVLSRVAKHILGFANSGGGAVVFGVQQQPDGSLQAAGLATLQEKTDVLQGVEKFLPQGLRFEILDFAFPSSEYGPIVGKKFQVLLVEDDPSHLPFLAEADGEDIRRGAVYVRRNVSTAEATHEDVQELVNRRLATGHSSSREMTLQKHLEDLDSLYQHIPTEVMDERYTSIYAQLQGFGIYKPNPYYPKETVMGFVLRMIERKKDLIESLLLDKKG